MQDPNTQRAILAAGEAIGNRDKYDYCDAVTYPLANPDDAAHKVFEMTSRSCAAKPDNRGHPGIAGSVLRIQVRGAELSAGLPHSEVWDGSEKSNPAICYHTRLDSEGVPSHTSLCKAV